MGESPWQGWFSWHTIVWSKLCNWLLWQLHTSSMASYVPGSLQMFVHFSVIPLSQLYISFAFCGTRGNVKLLWGQEMLSRVGWLAKASPVLCITTSQRTNCVACRNCHSCGGESEWAMQRRLLQCIHSVQAIVCKASRVCYCTSHYTI